MPLPTSSISGSANTSTSANQSYSHSQTYGTEATSASRAAASEANQIAKENWQKTAEFNAEQAKIQRDWQERMANTVYQRTMDDMRKAGLNPVLAAGGGLGTAAVGGGSAASMANPTSYMAGAFPDTISSSESQGNSRSSGSSWGESGFATFLESMTALINGWSNAMTSGQTINIGLQGLDSLIQLAREDYDKDGETTMNDSVEGAKKVIEGTESIGNWLLNEMNPLNGQLFGDLLKRNKNAKEYPKNYNIFENQ